MKVSPVERYAPRALPMQHEFDANTLNESPTSDRWQRAARVAGTCAALQWIVGCSADAEQSLAPAVAVATDGERNISQQATVAEQGSTLVVPLLEDALANDGRGAFGCVAVNPPAFLSEDEALDLIRKELAKAGLKPDETTVTVADVARPETETWPVPKRDKDGKPLRDAEGNWINEPLSFHSRAPFNFDLSFNNQKIRIEYIGMKDYREWEKPLSGMCTVSVYNFADTARRLRDSLVAQTDLERGVYGIFFDPMAHYGQRIPHPDTTGMSDEETKQAYDQYREEMEKMGTVAGKGQLKKQIDHFLAALQAQGLVASPSP